MVFSTFYSRLNLRAKARAKNFGHFARTQHMASSFSNSRGGGYCTWGSCPPPPGAYACVYVCVCVRACVCACAYACAFQWVDGIGMGLEQKTAFLPLVIQMSDNRII